MRINFIDINKLTLAAGLILMLSAPQLKAADDQQGVRDCWNQASASYKDKKPETDIIADTSACLNRVGPKFGDPAKRTYDDCIAAFNANDLPEDCASAGETRQICLNPDRAKKCAAKPETTKNKENDD